MEQYIGEIRMFAGNYAPEGWIFCNGQVLPISQYEALYSLIGITYGGDGQSTFALPDLRGRIPLHQGQNPQTGTAFTVGDKYGTETVALTVGQMPPHTHVVAASSVPGESASPQNAFWARKNTQYSSANPTAAMNPGAITTTGGSKAHDNMMPFLAVSFIIALEGEYPTRD